MTVPPIQEWCPAVCHGCKVRSKIRPLGETPRGWQREFNTDGLYFCPDCAAARVPCERCGGVTPVTYAVLRANGGLRAQHQRCTMNDIIDP